MRSRGNTAQLADPAFVKELKAGIRFNAADAARTRDGLYSVLSGNPNTPSWVSDVAFRRLLTPNGENDKYAHQVRSSAGIAVFVGVAADKAHWDLRDNGQTSSCGSVAAPYCRARCAGQSKRCWCDELCA
jgi:hypothetical protein